MTGQAHHRAASNVPGRRLRAVVTALVSAAVVATLAVAVPAAADPDGPGSGTSSSETQPPLQPSTAAQAKQAWLDASAKAEALNEDLLQAQEDEKQATQNVADAKIAVAQATLKVSSAQSTAVQAAARYAVLREQLSKFASASFRGARLGQLSALLTAESTSDYLDEVSSLDQVAGSTRVLMDEAFAAKQQAEAAAADADQAQADAVTAKENADTALKAAHAATEKVTEQKAALDEQVTVYHRLFSALSGQERAEAMQAQQAAWERQSRAEQQQAAQQQAAEDRIAQQRDGQDAAQLKSDASATADGSGEDAAIRSKAQIAVQAALSRLGMPYVWGATGPNAFDCSGLTSWAWAQAGISIPRTSAGQARLPRVPLDQLQPGDLVTYYSPVHHVGMYIGNGQIIHASTEGKPVFITSVYRGGPYPTGHRVTP